MIPPWHDEDTYRPDFLQLFRVCVTSDSVCEGAAPLLLENFEKGLFLGFFEAPFFDGWGSDLRHQHGCRCGEVGAGQSNRRVMSPTFCLLVQTCNKLPRCLRLERPVSYAHDYLLSHNTDRSSSYCGSRSFAEIFHIHDAFTCTSRRARVILISSRTAEKRRDDDTDTRARSRNLPPRIFPEILSHPKLGRFSPGAEHRPAPTKPSHDPCATFNPFPQCPRLLVSSF